MDLTNLRDSLDSSSLERHIAVARAKKSEHRVVKDFKAAALQLTTLYRTSLSSSKRSYAAGYVQSLSDVLDAVLLRYQQAPGSAPIPHLPSGADAAARVETDRDELRWLMQYLRARIDAIRADSEDDEREDSDEEEGGVRDQSVPACHVNQTLSPETETTPNRANSTSSAAEHLEIAPDQTDLGTSHHCAEVSAAISMSADTSSHVVSRANESFLFGLAQHAPTSSRTVLPTPKHRRQRGSHAAPHIVQSPSPANLLTSALALPQTATYTTHLPRASSSSDDEDTLRTAANNNSRPTTPSSRRTSARPGKRASGREKLSGLELFARAQQAKRRRGMGDKREDDSRDDGIL